MVAINAVATDALLDAIARHLVGDVADIVLGYFKLGEGGFIESGGVKTPKTPDPTRTRVEADGGALAGTSVTFMNASSDVSGIGTSFLTAVVPGQYVRLDVDLVWAQVLSVPDNNNLILTATYTGTGGTGDGSVITAPFFVFKKSFVGVDLTFLGTGTGVCTAVAFLDFIEGNDDGFGGNPEYFEIGIFDTNDVMVAYGTYPGETKVSTIQFNKVSRITLARP